MDRREVSPLKEILSGYNQFIFYSIQDFKQDFDKVEHGRNGILAFSKHNVNVKFRTLETHYGQVMGFDQFFRNLIVEQTFSKVEIDRDNLILSDRSFQRIQASIDLLSFKQYLQNNERYRNLVFNKDYYDTLFLKGIELKPILRYKVDLDSIEVVDFCDENLARKQESNLTDKISEFFSERSY